MSDLLPTPTCADPERLRFPAELRFADSLAAAGILNHTLQQDLPDADRIRRHLLTTHIRLSDSMAPEIFRWSNHAAKALGLTKPIEIYQAAGEENAANHTCVDTVFVSLRGSLVSSLDEASFHALLGHEFGHHLAHTAPFAGTLRLMAIRHSAHLAADPGAPLKIRVLASRVSMAKEFTADRFGAVAAASVDGPVRLLMAIVTGLPASRLANDVPSYLAQAHAIFDSSEKSETSPIGSHPEHLLRAYALSLFGESDLFLELTGKGPGGRPIAEVDALLENILTASADQIFEEAGEAALPQEVQEFALAAAVLIANADGDIDESEAKALEATFSDILAHWKELIDPEAALARFNELLPLAISGGEPAALAIFNILIHIILVDREIHVRELEVLTAIGRSLHQETLFNYLLAAIARKIRMERSDSPVERPVPALAPGSLETGAALHGLFAGLSRRGGGGVALSRILRILGANTWQAGFLTGLGNAASPHHLQLEAPPVSDPEGNIRQDQNLLFGLTDTERLRRGQATSTPAIDEFSKVKDRDSLLIALKHLRERLVSGDGRSPSIRLYRAAAGRHFDLARLDPVIAGRSERIVAQLYEAGTLPLLSGNETSLSKASADLARSLRTLDRESRARLEETGARDLHIGYPFLIGKMGAFFVRAPLILHPFSLSGDTRGGGSYQLKRKTDDPARANQALLRLLFAKKGYPFTEELANQLDRTAAESPESLLACLRDLGLAAKPLTGSAGLYEDISSAAADLLPEGIALSENAVIGFFPQSSSDLLQDYDELLARLDPASSASLESSLNAACDILPASHRPVFQATADAAAPDQPVIYSDPSQRAAVRSSRTARLLVVDGPPGTGKSQTIVNLVADTLARGGKVAIVCEKRVALDVVKQRLDSAGLGHLAALVHDVADDRKALYTHIADRLEAPERRQFDPARLTDFRKQAHALETHLAVRAQLLATPTAALLSMGQLHSKASNTATTFPHTFPGLATVDWPTLPRLLAALRGLHSFALCFASGHPLHSRKSLAEASDDDFRRILDNLQTAQQTARIYDQIYAATPHPPELLESSHAALTFAAGLPISDSAFPALMRLRREVFSNAVVEQGLATVAHNRTLLQEEKNRIHFSGSPELDSALTDARRHAGSFFKFLKPAWRRASAILRETLQRDWPEKASAKLDPALFGAMERRLAVSRAWASAAEFYQLLGIPSQLPGDAATLLTRHEQFLKLWEQTAGMAAARPALKALKLWPEASTADWTDTMSGWQAAQNLLTAQRSYYAAVRTASVIFPDILSADPARMQAMEVAFTKDAPELRQADQALAGLSELLPVAGDYVGLLADNLPQTTPETWCDACTRAWAESHLLAAEAAHPAITGLDSSPPMGSDEAASAQLLKLHQQISAEESLRLAAAGDLTGLMAVLPAEARVRRSPEQAAREILLKETRKQRSITPMRTLVRKHAREILDVVPVWLMSPETTAILFPREPIFDLLIIDEASQCTVENGLPVLTRARRAVVSGDDKQMPPSSFFKAGAGLEIDEDAESEVAPDAFASESLLVLARASGAGAPLRWHYRALFEELIAFSNHSMYGGSLLTVPSIVSRSAPPAIRWVHLPHGTWEKGVNLPEAVRVVDLMVEVLSRPSPPSVGIITFNLSQRRAILDEIDHRRSTDNAFSSVWDTAAAKEALDERPFVKNLESVQGDERTVIIFSLGYAPVLRKRKDGSEETYVPARFGPLGQKGGERRLNVAVSRAKAEVIVVSSFLPSMLSVANTKHDGPRMFKAFVEFARHLGEGRRSHAEKILILVNDTAAAGLHKDPALNRKAPTGLPLHHQIALALADAGLNVETMVGTSEFRLPVAIVTDGNDQRYALAILCEEGDHSTDVYEDYVHVPNVLAHRGWRHLRVTSRQWHRCQEATLQRIRNALTAS
jgi:AAA domain/REase_MTES_1575/Protein of unknown function (DUF4011)